MKDRIKQILEQYNLSNTAFAEKVGIPKSGLSHILSGRNNPSLDYVMKILEAFPDIDTNWLLKGESELNIPDNPNVKKQSDLFNVDKEEIKEEDMPEYNSPGVQKPENVSLSKSDIYADSKIEKIIVFYMDNSFKTYFPR